MLDRNEFSKLMRISGEEVTREIVEDIFNIIDQNKNGTISFNEFLKQIL